MSIDGKPMLATVAKSQRLQRMLEDPQFAAAWRGWVEQLDEGLVLIKRGVMPTGQAIGDSAQRVYEAFDALPKSVIDQAEDE